LRFTKAQPKYRFVPRMTTRFEQATQMAMASEYDWYSPGVPQPLREKQKSFID